MKKYVTVHGELGLRPRFVRVITGPRRDIVVAQSLKCTVQSAQLKPPTKTQILCPHPPKKRAPPPPLKLKLYAPTP